MMKKGGFSVKKPGKGKGKGASKVKSVVKVSTNIFGETATTTKVSDKIEVKTLDDIEQKKQEKKELVIKPILNADSWEYKRREALKQLRLQEENSEAKAEVELKEIETKLSESSEKSENLKIDINGADENPTEESYKQVPLAEFGMAMLRGMGWNEQFEREKIRKAQNSGVKR
ncbi:hypothetical protein DAMA08_003870 [Martiniozyma asiatica (nom. inval.)]|nr:hypothetical protein DAMA08_003870 [Martiniozyma asiatica]